MLVSHIILLLFCLLVPWLCRLGKCVWPFKPVSWSTCHFRHINKLMIFHSIYHLFLFFPNESSLSSCGFHQFELFPIGSTKVSTLNKLREGSFVPFWIVRDKKSPPPFFYGSNLKLNLTNMIRLYTCSILQ